MTNYPAPGTPEYDQQCNDVIQALSRSAQDYAISGNTARYEEVHRDINAALDMKQAAQAQGN